MFVGEILLAAGIGDVLGVLVPIVFFVIYLINQLIAGKGNPQQQRGPQPRGQQQAGQQRRGARPQAERALRPPQQAGRPQQAGDVRGAAAQLNEEIEQFLKRAGQRRGERAQRESPARPMQGRKQPLRTPTAPPRSQLSEVPLDVLPLDEPVRESIAASVEKHLPTATFAQRAEHLADDIVLVDRQMEDHLQAAFRHRVGTLGTEPIDGTVTDEQTAVTTDAPSPAVAIAQSLRTPQGMRDAIVLSEVLARPEHRW